MQPTLFFDFDGTLIDSAPGILQGYQVVLAHSGRPAQVPISTAIIGPPLAVTLSQITGETDPERLATWVQLFKDSYDHQGYQATLLYPHLQPTLQTLQRQGYRMILLTNKRRLPTLKILDWFDLSPYFEQVYTPDSWTPALPSKIATMGRALAELGLNPQHCCMIGDSRDDAEAAHHHGMTMLGVRYGYGNVTTQTEFPCPWQLDDLAELPALLARACPSGA